jgi:seryl-tRNA synthetase
MHQVELDLPVQRKYQDDILKNLYWVDSGLTKIQFDPGNENLLQFTYQGGETPEVVGARLKETAHRLSRSLSMFPSKSVYESPARTVPGCAGPYEKLVSKGWVKPMSDGSHIYAGLMSDLYHALDIQFRTVALQMGVEECKFPTLIGLDTLARSGYLEGFPHNANFVCHLPEQAEIVEKFKAEAKQTSGMPGMSLDAAFARPSQALSPTVCYHYYKSHEKQVLSGNIIGATASSPCYRFEGKATLGLRRLREFNMREIMFIGTPEEVLLRRQRLLDVQQRMLDFCQLQSVIQTASDPFFVDTYDKKRIFQMSFDLKHEVQAYLPEDDVWLAIGSVNYHQDHFGKAFEMKLPSGETAHSCCLGFGLDRWCMAIFAQYGIELQQWPEALQALVSSFSEARNQLYREGKTP